MKRYIDGYVIPVPKKNVKAYQKLARKSGKIFLKHGALQVVESVGEDMQFAKHCGSIPMSTLAKVKKNETVIFSYIVYKSRAHRDRVNKAVFEDPAMDQAMQDDIAKVFNYKRMSIGGFESLVFME